MQTPLKSQINNGVDKIYTLLLYHSALIIFLIGLFILKRILSVLYRRQNPNGNRSNSTTHHHPTGNGNDTIIDNRTSEQTQRKIFNENEGEYIDYSEEP
ncbi:DUF4834 family protein [Hoylesella saccharolytica]|uniref:DUF4834 family protein n=1 Tax=Hoylesella saccharolytica TaxID=633701 RepID=UPI00055F0F8A